MCRRCTSAGMAGGMRMGVCVDGLWHAVCTNNRSMRDGRFVIGCAVRCFMARVLTVFCTRSRSMRRCSRPLDPAHSVYFSAAGCAMFTSAPACSSLERSPADNEPALLAASPLGILPGMLIDADGSLAHAPSPSSRPLATSAGILRYVIAGRHGRPRQFLNNSTYLRRSVRARSA
jgi:hypothetical protein